MKEDHYQKKWNTLFDKKVFQNEEISLQMFGLCLLNMTLMNFRIFTRNTGEIIKIITLLFQNKTK